MSDKDIIAQFSGLLLDFLDQCDDNDTLAPRLALEMVYEKLAPGEEFEIPEMTVREMRTRILNARAMDSVKDTQNFLLWGEVKNG